MKNSEINIRDPYVLCENGTYYLYGTRAKDFGYFTGGIDVYVGTDLESWSEPKEVFNSIRFGLNRSVNWAPEVHPYRGKYYMFATFEQENGNKGTYSLVSDTPDGEFVPLSKGALTPADWFSLDGTLYLDRQGKPYLVFCHEHAQILNGTMCYVPLTEDLSAPAEEVQYMFSATDAYGCVENEDGHYVTDGPFFHRGTNDRLYLMWSTHIQGNYHQCLAVSSNGEIDGDWIQLPPIFDKDGGHGMLFTDLDGKLHLTLHTPNTLTEERPAFYPMTDTGDTLKISE